jgi:16S rRNA G966 N2-methylase RsmD
VRNEEECVCSVCLFCSNIFIGVRIIKEMLGSVASGTPCIIFKTINLPCVKSQKSKENFTFIDPPYKLDIFD